MKIYNDLIFKGRISCEWYGSINKLDISIGENDLYMGQEILIDIHNQMKCTQVPEHKICSFKYISMLNQCQLNLDFCTKKR